MQRQLEPVLKTRLTAAAALMGELLRPREDIDDTYVDIVLDDLELDEDEHYVSYEVVRELPTSSIATTTKFERIRDTTHDHVVTVKLPRIDADTLEVPLYSAPYERVDIQAGNDAHFTAYPNANQPDPLPLPLYSAPYVRVDLEDRSHAFVKVPADWSAESTEIVAASKPSVLFIIAVLFGALASGLGIVLLAIRG